MATTQKMSESRIITRFFRDPTQPLREFADELRALTVDSKHELAVGCAEALGISQAGCAFKLDA